MCSKKKLLEYDKKDKKRCHIDLGTEDIYIYPSSNKFNGYLIKSQKFEF